MIRLSLLLVAMGVMFTLLIGYAPEASRSRIESLLSGQLNSSAVTRVDLYSESWQSIMLHPWGTGWGSFELLGGADYRYPHNLVLETLVEMGWIAGAAFVGWVLWRCVATWHHGGTFEGMAILGVTAFTFVNAMVSGDLNDNRVLFFSIGMGYALSMVARTEQPVTRRTDRLSYVVQAS
jgi:O-antigen ligase